MLLGASNAWFPMLMSALSIPTQSNRLEQIIEQQWSAFEVIQDAATLAAARRFGLRELAEFSDEQVLSALERMRNEQAQEPVDADLKTAEWAIFSAANPIRNSFDLQLRPVLPPDGYGGVLERVVLVERLREVVALTGFTRIDPPGEDSPAARAPISRGAPHWVPAAEVRGEGIFLQFKESQLAAWEARNADLDKQFRKAHERWRAIRRLDPEKGYPGLRYVLLHSFAHALIRQVSIECGYSMASIRERIYSSAPGTPLSMAGVLIYTAATDSEGTLGGLVSLGRPMEFGRHLDGALENLQLCSSDPLCAESTPEQQFLALHGAACHACLFAPETSCERGNRYLDRSVLVETIERRGFAFFGQ
jgi:hypothetical protein